MAALGHVTASPPIFEPRLTDARVPSVGLGFTLGEPGTVTWTTVNAAGATVRTLASSEPKAAGTYAAPWDGTGSATGGPPVLLPDGQYQQIVTITMAAGSSTLGTRFTMAPMRIELLAATRHAGQPPAVSVTFAEPLRGTPLMTVTQPGVGKYRLTATRLGADQFRVAFRLRPGAATATLVIAVSGVGVGGASLSASAKLPVR